MWKRLFEDWNKKQGEEIERLRREYKKRSERLAMTTAVERAISTRNIPRRQSPMELLTPREVKRFAPPGRRANNEKIDRTS